MWRQTVSAPEQAGVVRSGQFDGDDYVAPICRFTQSEQFELSSKCLMAPIFCGLIVGLLSGLFGVGDGFFIVPALLYITQVSMRQAVACIKSLQRRCVRYDCWSTRCSIYSRGSVTENISVALVSIAAMTIFMHFRVG